VALSFHSRFKSVLSRKMDTTAPSRSRLRFGLVGAVPSKEHMDTSPGPAIDKEEPPPFLGSWRRIYIAIVIYLVTVIALFGLFTRSLNR